MMVIHYFGKDDLRKLNDRGHQAAAIFATAITDARQKYEAPGMTPSR